MKDWIKAAATRAVKTVAQSAAALIIADVTIWQMDWVQVIGISLTAGLLSVLTSVGGLPEVNELE